MPYKINPVTGNLDYYEAPGAGSGANLTYTPSPTNGVVVSDSGTDATIPLADATNAGLMTAAEQTKLAGIATGATANQTLAHTSDATTHTATLSGTGGSIKLAEGSGITLTTTGTLSNGIVTIASTISDIQSTITNNTQVLANTAKISFDSTSSTRLANTSGTNTGDNAVNSLYSGLAASKQDAITLTTTGTSGAATLSGNTLNIPQYSVGATTNVFELKPNYIYRGITINNNSTTVTAEGGVVMTPSASNTAQSVASTNFATKQIRLRYYATSVTGGRYTGTRGSALLWYIQGGFHYVCDFNISDTAFAAGCQQFYGMAGQTTDLSYGTSTPILVSTLINIVGVGNEVGDTNLQVFHNDATGTASKIDLGIDFPANRTSGAISTTFYSVHLYNTPSSTDVHYKVTNNETGAVATGVVSTNLPLSSQGLNFFASRSMAATSVTSTGQFDLSKLGVYSIL